MTFRLHGEGGSESAYEAVAYTVDALSAQAGDAELTQLAGRVSGLLGDWEAIDADRRRLRRIVLGATARARVADATLDAAIHAFAHDLLAAVGNDTAAPLYTRFFPEAHEDIIEMGLDSEVPVVTLLLANLDSTDDVPEALKAHADALRAGLKLGNSALLDRSDALADLGRHSAREQAWAETAVSTLRSVHRHIVRLATARALPIAWADAFVLRRPG